MDTLGTAGWIIKLINGVLDITSNALDFVFLWGGLVLILGYPFYSFFKNIKNYNKKSHDPIGDIFSQTLILFLAMVVVGVVWLIPESLNFIWPTLIQKGPIFAWCATAFRWAALSSILLFLAYFFGHENGDRRWLQSSIGHIALVFLGLFIDHWTGILFITLPLFAAYYSILYRLSLITLPASDPEDNAERWKRFIIFVSYTWGIQFPLMVVDENAWKKIEARIPGDFTRNFLTMPGFIWTRAHQVVSITGGMKFKRVDGPGMVFTGYLERPEQAFDLRLQLRTNEIDVVSKDGISFIVRVFTAFRIDPETWDKDTYAKLRPMNAILRGADKPSYTKGSFPYSNLRVQAALGVTSTKADPGNPTIYWDQWAINVVEDQSRKVISQKKLDELWRPAEDGQFVNAMDSIANEIKERARFTLRAAGVLLVAARVVNFHFPKNGNDEADGTDEISEQQLATWGAEWERKSNGILAEAEAESEHAQQAARAYAEALMLNSIAESLQKTKEMDPRLPQYVIATRFLSALQDHIREQPLDEDQNSDQERKKAELHNYLKEWQDQFLPYSGREK